MQRDQLIAELRRTAELNGGAPFGEARFYRETGLSLYSLQREGFSTYTALRLEAGYPRGAFQQALSEDELFGPLARLVRQLGHFPTKGELVVAHHSPDRVPTYGCYLRLKTKHGPLDRQLLAWCHQKEDFSDVRKILETTHARGSAQLSAIRGNGRIVNGYVYLMRFGSIGRDYKIGCTANVSRRQTQLDMMSPKDVRRVHVIETDDPRGIEGYWLNRFADRRLGNKEIFRLTAEDVAAFKSRRYQ